MGWGRRGQNTLKKDGGKIQLYTQSNLQRQTEGSVVQQHILLLRFSAFAFSISAGVVVRCQGPVGSLPARAAGTLRGSRGLCNGEGVTN